MIAMQYKILLPNDYDMDKIYERVIRNGKKTDGFQDLLFKAYLVAERGSALNSCNEYSPLYLWKDSNGMNKFIFNGFYDNILNSFGWQKINIGIPLLCDMGSDFSDAKYVLEVENPVEPMQRMKSMDFSLDAVDKCAGKVLIYNPDKWRYVEYYFFTFMPKDYPNAKTYRILHISM